ncbi:MAG: DMT family transporter [Desulfuromonadales bacterium]|nr:DMT family transporter [Desulfuromonadales bacterium]MBN2792562.1 DMT family transporter [Desulfuromonadales bacterium]
MNYSEHTKGLILTFTAVLILSPDALLVRLIDTDIWTLLFWRCLLTATMMSLFLMLRYRRGFFQSFRATGKTGLLSALTITIGSLLFVNSLKHTAAANTLIILSATPVISSLLSWLILREAIPLRTKVAIFTCFGGILFIFSGSLQSGLFLGDLLALGATTMWGSNIVIIRRGKDVNMIPANVLGNLSVVPIVLLLGAQPLQVTPANAGILLLLGGLILPVSFAMITLGPRYLQAPEVSLILLTETILGPIWVWLVLAEVPHPRTMIAGLLIICTLIIHTLMSLSKPLPVNRG